MTLIDTSLWQEVVDLFGSVYQLKVKCECGQTVSCVVHPYTLEERPYCKACSEKRDLETREKEKEALIRGFLSRADEILKKNGAPQMFLKARVADFGPVAKKYVDMQKGLFIFGDRGTGKTHLAVSLMREHLKKVQVVDRNGDFFINDRMVPAFISVPELLLEIRHSYSDSKTSEKAIIGQYTEKNFLVLDDLGAEKTTDWSLQILYIIVDRRYREEKRTIFTSNLDLDELASKFDDRIASRISGMCVLHHMKGVDRRLKP